MVLNEALLSFFSPSLPFSPLYRKVNGLSSALCMNLSFFFFWKSIWFRKFNCGCGFWTRAGDSEAAEVSPLEPLTGIDFSCFIFQFLVYVGFVCVCGSVLN